MRFAESEKKFKNLIRRKKASDSWDWNLFFIRQNWIKEQLWVKITDDLIKCETTY